jgi:hypothetical protein
MAGEDTLEGLRSTILGRSAEDGCREMVKTPMQSLGGIKMYRCKGYVDPDDIVTEADGKVAGLDVFSIPESVERPKRKRGRPKGSTVRAGARRPRMPRCDESTVEWKKVRRFKRKGNPSTEWRCRCNTSGNHNYVPDEMCERVVGQKPR